MLFGKGHLDHYGNLRFRQLIYELSPDYELADRHGKTELAERVVRSVKQGGGRFLKKGAAGWAIASDEVAREKASHRFRQIRGKRTSPENNRGEKRQGPPPVLGDGEGGGSNLLQPPPSLLGQREVDRAWFCDPRSQDSSHKMHRCF